MTDETALLSELMEALDSARKYLFILDPEINTNRFQLEDEHKFQVILEVLENHYGASFKDDIEQSYDIKLVHKHGGIEDAGPDMWFILKHKDNYFKLAGYYQSEGDSEYYWDDIHHVEPKQVLVTQYERVNNAPILTADDPEGYEETDNDSWDEDSWEEKDDDKVNT